MTSLAEVIRRHGPAYLARHGGAVLPSHVRAIEAITGCRTAAMGGHLGQCDACGAVHLVHHSCRHRACAQCGLDTTTRWIARHEERLLPVPYFHLVFTLPAELRRVVRAHQSALLDVLFRAAFESLQELASDERYLGARVGALAVLHTWTRTLEWHPHIHMLVPGGGLGPDGRTFRSARRPGRADFLVPVRPLAKLFRGRFLHLARAALPDVPLPQIPWGKNWVVYAKRSVGGPPDHLLEYLGRYIHRTAITNHRLVDCDAQSVTFAYRDSQTGKRKVQRLSGSEFLRRFLQHVPPRGFHRVRAFGLLHPHHRQTVKRLQLLLASRAPAPPAQAEPPPLRRPAPRCPTCQSGTLVVVTRLSAAELRAFETAPLALAPPARGPP